MMMAGGEVATSSSSVLTPILAVEHPPPSPLFETMGKGHVVRGGSGCHMAPAAAVFIIIIVIGTVLVRWCCQGSGSGHSVLFSFGMLLQGERHPHGGGEVVVAGVLARCVVEVVLVGW